jgi:putative lysine transport system permease protein
MPETFFGWVFFLANKYGGMFVRASGFTLLVALSGTIIGFAIGLLVGVVRTIPIAEKDNALKKIALRVVRAMMVVYIEVFRGTPMMVQAMLIYYGSLQYLGIRMSWLFAAIFIVSINTGAYMAEIVRGGIISVDKGQVEGAQSIGMTHWQTMVFVVLPQAVRNIMPAIGNEFVVNIKDSSVLNVIGVFELFYVARSASGTYLKFFESFFIVSVIYLAMTFTVTRIMLYIERRMDGPNTFVIHGSQTTPQSSMKINQ